jgi:hypothetical protein
MCTVGGGKTVFKYASEIYNPGGEMPIECSRILINLLNRGASSLFFIHDHAAHAHSKVRRIKEEGRCRMGIKGLMKLINENVESICTAPQSMRGELIIDGYGILHELYEKYKLDWANGGCYGEQHRATLEYFECMANAGVKPIVIVDGGGSAMQHADTVHRRQKDIRKTTENIKQHHQGAAAPHTLPIMAREIFVSSLREKNVDVYVADGKATKTIVYLANYYDCPVLTNNTYYCVCNVNKGVVFFKNLNISTCTAPVYEQTKIASFLGISTDLLYAVVAVIGDGSDKYVPFLYHGRIKAKIEECASDNSRGRSWVLNVVDFLKAKRITCFAEFEQKLRHLNFGGMCNMLSENCKKVETVYVQNYMPRKVLSIEELNASTTIKCSKPCPLPITILKAYRIGMFPVLAMNAMTIGKCALEQTVGDVEQPPIPVLGRRVRQLIYGLVSSFMNREGQTGVFEFHRTDRNLEYDEHIVAPLCEEEELLTTNINSLDEVRRKDLAMQAVCKVLQCPEYLVHSSEVEGDKMLVALVTRYWSSYIIEREPMPNPNQLVKAVVLNFFFNSSDRAGIDEGNFSDPDWIKVYHALVEWQSLYRNVCSLNTMLCQPFRTISPSFLFDGPFIIFLALHPSPDIIDTYAMKLSISNKSQYRKLLASIIV